MQTIKTASAVAALVVTVGGTVVAAAQAADLHSSVDRDSSAAPVLYKNCTNLNKKYPHGLGRSSARDRTSDTPVSNFKRSTRLYDLAMSYNRGLDRDKDGIACEKT
jgi:hypothetical protein